MAFKKLYIGGKRDLEGYIHIRLDRENLDSVLKLPYKNCCVEDVIVDRVLEYIPPEKLAEAIVEWRRVLCIGGRFVLLYTDCVNAAILYQRNVLTFEQLQLVFRKSYKTVLTKNKIENLLILRYPNVHEETVYPFQEKKLWQRIFVALKGRNE